MSNPDRRDFGEVQWRHLHEILLSAFSQVEAGRIQGGFTVRSRGVTISVSLDKNRECDRHDISDETGGGSNSAVARSKPEFLADFAFAKAAHRRVEGAWFAARKEIAVLEASRPPAGKRLRKAWNRQNKRRLHWNRRILDTADGIRETTMSRLRPMEIANRQAIDDYSQKWQDRRDAEKSARARAARLNELRARRQERLSASS